MKKLLIVKTFNQKNTLKKFLVPVDAIIPYTSGIKKIYTRMQRMCSCSNTSSDIDKKADILNFQPEEIHTLQL